MKKLFYLSLIIILFSNCRSSNKPVSADSTKPPVVVDRTQELIKEFGPIINGIWVKADYIEKIKQTKSPLEASGLTDDIMTMIIYADSVKNDSLIVASGCGNHEGCNVTIKFTPGKTPSSILFNGNDLTYRIANGDTTLYINEPPLAGKNKRLVKYIKSSVTRPTELGSGLYRMVNQALVAGKYNMTDSAGTVSKVSFSADGKVTGFLNASDYYINIDLNDDVMDNLDEIIFDPMQNKARLSYTYKIVADTLKLYSIQANADSTEAILDKLKYTLVRVR